jgi:hypothetical protein
MRVNTTTGFALVLSLLSLVGCDDDPAPPPPKASADAGPDAPSELCPPADDPRVHYSANDPNACGAIELACTEGQNGFDNACGCGCIDKGDPVCPPVDDPAITWISRDPAQCSKDPPLCPSGQNPFSSTCGCGCSQPGA